VTEADEPPGSPEWQTDPSWGQKVLALHEHLEHAALPYAFGGAIALNYHREPRSTLDVHINIFVAPERRDDVLNVLSGIYAFSDRERIEGQLAADGQARTRWNNTYIDLFLANTEFHASMAQRVERKPFDSAEIPVLSIEDLLICKALFNRPKDWVDVAAVAAAEGPRVDQTYVNRWLTYFLGTQDERIEHFATTFR
jgi:hypothetical protein